jgi:nucleoside-diphosphate-sugar epimerase
MRIAILGATSTLARDFISALAADDRHDLVLFARQPLAVKKLFIGSSPARYRAAAFSEFRDAEKFDALINFVGAGDPARIMEMGASIFDVTAQYDEMALGYLHSHPECRYLFLSSGAAYGGSFDVPADSATTAVTPINALRPQDWYGAAKLHAECRHRAMKHRAIVDIRVFSYFSHTQDISSRFFITDILRAIKAKDVLSTSSDNIIRDYIGPEEFANLVTLLLSAPFRNDVLDCYTKCPVDKMTLLAAMKEQFGLLYEVCDQPATLNATGVKLNYFSKNFRAENYGYSPRRTSLEVVLSEAAKTLDV